MRNVIMAVAEVTGIGCIVAAAAIGIGLAAGLATLGFALVAITTLDGWQK